MLFLSYLILIFILSFPIYIQKLFLFIVVFNKTRLWQENICFLISIPKYKGRFVLPHYNFHCGTKEIDNVIIEEKKKMWGLLYCAIILSEFIFLPPLSVCTLETFWSCLVLIMYIPIYFSFPLCRALPRYENIICTS